MVNALTPLAIIIGGILATALIFSSIWKRSVNRIRNFGSFYEHELDIADMNIKSQELGFVVVTIAALAWIGLVIAVRPNVVVGLLFLPMVLGFTVYSVKVYLRQRIAKTVRKFRDQLESVLRSLASGVRVGLGLRQALLLVAEQSKNPARKELTRVIGAANMGTSIFDELDVLGQRMPLPETQMLARVIRIQSQSGGDLAQVLDGLAQTIRDRRRLERKIAGLTAQSRATAWLLGSLPLLMCVFILATQPSLRVAMLGTSIGQACIGVGVLLDAAAVFFLHRLTQLDA